VAALAHCVSLTTFFLAVLLKLSGFLARLNFKDKVETMVMFAVNEDVCSPEADYVCIWFQHLLFVRVLLGSTELFDLVSTGYKKIILIFAPSLTVCATL
jgi:hypothetical protein